MLPAGCTAQAVLYERSATPPQQGIRLVRFRSSLSNNNSVSSINYFKTALPSSPSLPIYSACSQQLSAPPPAQPGYVAHGVQSQTLMLSQGFASSARASDVAKVTLLGRIGSEPVERQVGGPGGCRRHMLRL